MTDLFINAKSFEIERAVLSVLWDGRYKEAIGTFLELITTPDAFADIKHRTIAKVISQMVGQGLRIDGLSIGDALQQIRFEDAIEKGKERAFRFEEGVEFGDSARAWIGEFVLGEIGQGSGSASGFRGNCERLLEYHRQRLLIQTLADTLEKAKAVDGRTKLLRTGDQVINDVAKLLGGAVLSSTMDEAMGSALATHDAAQLRGEVRSASWGLKVLDKRIPLRAGTMIVLAAAPGHGKTSLALQSAQATIDGLGPGSVGIISLEMEAERLARIMIARKVGASIRAIENGWLNAAKRAEAQLVHESWIGKDLGIKSLAGSCSAEDACAWIRQRHLRSGGRLALVVVDYLQLIDRSHPKQMDYELLTNASRMLKRIAGELRICVLVLSAMSRGGRAGIRDARSGEIKANPEPRKEDLRGSGSIEGDADGIVFIWTESVDPAPQMPVHLKTDKNRAGPEGSDDAIFDKANGQVFRDMVATSQELVDEARPDASRAHHNHTPQPSEDPWGDAQPAGAIGAIP